jgi:hypothetical protein
MIRVKGMIQMQKKESTTRDETGDDTYTIYTESVKASNDKTNLVKLPIKSKVNKDDEDRE